MQQVKLRHAFGPTEPDVEVVSSEVSVITVGSLPIGIGVPTLLVTGSMLTIELPVRLVAVPGIVA
jgi:hypothetical protein